MKTRKGAPTTKGGQRALAPRGSASDDDDALVISGTTTLLLALFIVAIGAGMAILFFTIHQPGCMKGMTFGIADAKVFAAPEMEQTAKTGNENSATRRNLRRKLLPQEEGESNNHYNFNGISMDNSDQDLAMP